jgi:uncharacterized protein YkwD
MLLRLGTLLIGGVVGLVGGFFGGQVIDYARVPSDTPPAIVSTTSIPAGEPTVLTTPPVEPAAPKGLSQPATQARSDRVQPSMSQKGTSSPDPETDPTRGISVTGIFIAGNDERKEHGTEALILDDQLTAMAKRKANDMFTHQYFAHDSPSGVGVEELAARVGYDYLLVGENLALGNFTSSAEIVQAWMDSPGHRANLLKSQYSHIGIAVVEGMFEGDRVWIAVQEFGLPRAVCPEPAEKLKATISSELAKLAALKKTIAQHKEDAEDAVQNSAAWEHAVDAYNTAVATHNDLVDSYREDVSQYNAQVSVYNDCLAQVTEP